MRIVNLDQFLAMPSGTVFSKYQPECFDGLAMKGESIHDARDFFYFDIAEPVPDSVDLERAEQSIESFDLDFHIQSRDGCFDDDQLFAVWERSDVRALIERLQATLL